MSVSTPGPSNRKPGDIRLSGAQRKPDGPDGPVGEVDKDEPTTSGSDVTADETAARPEESDSAGPTRPSARRSRRTPREDDELAQRDEGSADRPSEKTDAEEEAQDDQAPSEAEKAESPADKAQPEGDADKPAESAAAAVPERPTVVDLTPAAQSGGASGMFGVSGSGDTSGFGGLVRPAGFGVPFESSPRPYGGWFDEVADSLQAGYPQWNSAHIATLVDRGEITFYVKREHIARILQVCRDDQALRFELLSSLSGVDYLREEDRLSSSVDARVQQYADQRLHVVYHLASLTYRRRIRLEVATSVEDPHVPSAVRVYPTADWQERETYDMFGIVFDGHPALTRILMPDDWDGHPQRKDYPLGGIPVEYKGAQIPPPDERRAYR